MLHRLLFPAEQAKLLRGVSVIKTHAPDGSNGARLLPGGQRGSARAAMMFATGRTKGAVRAIDRRRLPMCKLILITAIALTSTSPCYANLSLAELHRPRTNSRPRKTRTQTLNRKQSLCMSKGRSENV